MDLRVGEKEATRRGGSERHKALAPLTVVGELALGAARREFLERNRGNTAGEALNRARRHVDLRAMELIEDIVVSIPRAGGAFCPRVSCPSSRESRSR